MGKENLGNDNRYDRTLERHAEGWSLVTHNHKISNWISCLLWMLKSLSCKNTSNYSRQVKDIPKDGGKKEETQERNQKGGHNYDQRSNLWKLIYGSQDPGIPTFLAMLAFEGLPASFLSKRQLKAVITEADNCKMADNCNCNLG